MLEAIREGRTDLIFELLAQGHPADGDDGAGVALTQWCAYYGDVSGLRYLLERGAELESLGTNFDLNGAAFHGHWRLCQFLLERGADVDMPLADTGETPLHAAVCRAGRIGAARVVDVLLAHGADPNQATKAGVESGCFMRDARTRGETVLHRAAAFSSEAVIAELIKAGGRLDARDVNGDSPLSWASFHGRPAHVLKHLCFGEHSVNPVAVERSRALLAIARESSMDANLQGRPLNAPR